MSRDTPIQWCDSSCNPSMGCDGCELWSLKERVCYAGTLHQMRGGQKGYAPTFEQVTMFPGRTEAASKWSDLSGTDRPDKPWLNGLPRLIFLSDMSDMLSNAVTDDFLVNDVIKHVSGVRGRVHQWLWLTKRTRRMAAFARILQERGLDWPKNLWAGTSITTQGSMVRLQVLRDVPAHVRFLSVEPQWEGINLRGQLDGIHLVINGGQSVSSVSCRPFFLRWPRDIMDACRESGVAYFLKQLGARPFDCHPNARPLVGFLGLKDKQHGGNWDEWPEDLRVREMPRTRLREAA